ncbi:MAG: hypothetical protein IT431_00635 [Phycisphaerales bacterium]|nr:hypothetical protein [Phycisphaerales bacterium]
MRVFWALMVGLVIASGVMLAVRGGGPRDGAASPASRTSIEQGPEVDAVPEPAAEPAPAAGSPAPEEPVVVGVGVADADEADLESGPEPVSEPAPLAEDLAVSAPAEATPAEDAPAADVPAPGESAPEQGAGATLTLNGRYPITGSGTAEDPYKIDFDMLVALEHDYQPKTAGKDMIPEWITPLNGKVVEITGFIGFPFIAPTADECMVMLNQWDGCCIGVPPTPYDAVEVQLAEEVDLGNGVPNYGTIRGVFRADPYLVNGWLIGLYVMDEATLRSAGSRDQTGF